MTKRVTWVVNPTKLCNLRCSYCYEWNELSNPARMSPELLRRVLEGVRDLHLELEGRFPNVVTNVSWLGGEPLLLPIEYLEQIMAIEHEVLGELIARRAFHNVVQTNLYQLSDAAIEFLHRHRWKPGVSLDVVPGVRVSVNGRETERRVMANVERLRKGGVEPDAITVLARHTLPRVVEVYDYFASHGFRRVRFLPLFAGPAERPMESVVASNDEIARALCDLFVHWIETGTKVVVDPLQEYLHNVLLRRVGLSGELYDRRRHGEGVLVVNTNGDVYHLLDAYEPSRAMGNLGRDAVADILASPVAEWTHQRDAALRASMCEPCPYAGACNGTPALESPREGRDGGRCPVAYRVYEFIDAYLRQIGIDDSGLAGMVNELAAEAPDA